MGEQGGVDGGQVPSWDWRSAPRSLWVGLASSWLVYAIGFVVSSLTFNGEERIAGGAYFVVAAAFFMVLAGFVSLVMLELWERSARGGSVARVILGLLLFASTGNLLSGGVQGVLAGDVVQAAWLVGAAAGVVALVSLWRVSRAQAASAGASRLPLGGSLLRVLPGQVFAGGLMAVSLVYATVLTLG